MGLEKLNGRPVRLIAFDLDGTIFCHPTKQEASPRLTRAFEAAHEAGVVLAASTGRAVWMLGEQLQRAPWLDWAITGNGARVVPMRGAPSGARGLECEIPRQQALVILEEAEELDAIVDAHTQKKSLAHGLRDRPLPEFAQGLLDGNEEVMSEMQANNPILALFETGEIEEVGSVSGAFLRDPTLRLDKLDLTFRSPLKAKAMQQRLKRLEGVEVACLGAMDVEITRAGVSKGEAIGWLCSQLGFGEERAVAFGDSGNDLSMAGRATTFVAVGNASPEVLAAADDVCPSVLDDGVAVWIEEHVLQRGREPYPSTL